MSITASVCSHMPDRWAVCSKIVCSVSHPESECWNLVPSLCGFLNWVETPRVGIVEDLAMIKYWCTSNQKLIQNEACEVFLSVLTCFGLQGFATGQAVSSQMDTIVWTLVSRHAVPSYDLKCSSSSSRPLYIVHTQFPALIKM